MQNFQLIMESQTNTFRNNEFTHWCFLNGAFFKTTLPPKWPTRLTSSQSSHFYSQKTNPRQRHSVMRPQEDAKCSVSRYMREMCNPKATPAVSSLLEKPGKPPKQGYPEDNPNQIDKPPRRNHHMEQKLILDPMVTTPLGFILCATLEALPTSPHCTCLPRLGFHRHFMLEILGIIPPPQVCSSTC